MRVSNSILNAFKRYRTEMKISPQDCMSLSWTFRSAPLSTPLLIFRHKFERENSHGPCRMALRAPHSPISVKRLNWIYAKFYHSSWNLSKSFQENPYALENEEDVYESNGRFEPFSFLDSTLKVAEVVHSTLTLDTRMSENNPCSTPLGKIIKILAPEILAIVNNMFTTMTLFPLRIFIPKKFFSCQRVALESWSYYRSHQNRKLHLTSARFKIFVPQAGALRHISKYMR